MTVIQHDFRKKTEQDVSSDTPKVIPGYRLKLELGFSSPPVWRELDLCGSLSLGDLSKIIQICFGWNNEPGHRFLVGKIFYGPRTANGRQDIGDEAKTKLYKLEDVMPFIFTYLHDHGGGWECEITLQEIFAEGVKSRQPVLHDSDRANPPLGIDDIHEYIELLRQIELEPANRRPLLARHDIQPDFDPAHCDNDAINTLLASFNP